MCDDEASSVWWIVMFEALEIYQILCTASIEILYLNITQPNVYDQA